MKGMRHLLAWCAIALALAPNTGFASVPRSLFARHRDRIRRDPLLADDMVVGTSVSLVPGRRVAPRFGHLVPRIFMSSRLTAA